MLIYLKCLHPEIIVERNITFWYLSKNKPLSDNFILTLWSKTIKTNNCDGVPQANTNLVDTSTHASALPYLILRVTMSNFNVTKSPFWFHYTETKHKSEYYIDYSMWHYGTLYPELMIDQWVPSSHTVHLAPTIESCPTLLNIAQDYRIVHRITVNTFKRFYGQGNVTSLWHKINILLEMNNFDIFKHFTTSFML